MGAGPETRPAEPEWREIRCFVLVLGTLIRSRRDFTSFGLILGSCDWSVATNEAVITRPCGQKRNNLLKQSLGRCVISDSIAPLFAIKVDNIHLCLYNGSRRGEVTHFSQLQLDVTEVKRTRRA